MWLFRDLRVITAWFLSSRYYQHFLSLIPKSNKYQILYSQLIESEHSWLLISNVTYLNWLLVAVNMKESDSFNTTSDNCRDCGKEKSVPNVTLLSVLIPFVICRRQQVLEKVICQLIPLHIIFRARLAWNMSQTAAITSQMAATTITNTEKKQKENKPEAEKNSTEMMSNGGTAEQEQEIVDPFCNADNPQIITFQDVTSAAFKIKKGIEYTPCPVRRENSLTALPSSSSPHPSVDGSLNGSLRVLINEALINTNWRFYWNSFFFSIF